MIWGGNCTFCKLQHQPSFISSFPFNSTLIPSLRQNAVISGYNGLLKVTLVFPEINSSTHMIEGWHLVILYRRRCVIR